MKKPTLVIVIAAVLLFILLLIYLFGYEGLMNLLRIVKADKPALSSCAVIKDSGYYYFEKDISANDSWFCISVADASNVTIDCKGHSLVGSGTGYEKPGIDTQFEGIRIRGGKNVTVKNCNITKFFTAIRVADTEGVGIFQNRIWQNTEGAAIYYATYVNVSQNSFETLPGFASRLDYCKDCEFSSNNVSNSSELEVYWTRGVLIKGNVFSGNGSGTGIRAEMDEDGVIESNTFKGYNRALIAIKAPYASPLNLNISSNVFENNNVSLTAEGTGARIKANIFRNATVHIRGYGSMLISNRLCGSKNPITCPWYGNMTDGGANVCDENVNACGISCSKGC